MFHVLRGGCAARHPHPFSFSKEQGVPNYVLLFIHTAGEFQIGGRYMRAMPGHAVLITPKTPYHYQNTDSEYIDDWLHFEYIPNDKENLTFPPFPPVNQLFLVRSIEIYSFLLRQLLWEKSYAPSECLEENTDALFRVLFNHLHYDSIHPSTVPALTPFQEKLRLIRIKLQNSPEQEHHIAEYARQLKISESYFQHLYRRLFGISFQKDCIRMRVEHSKELLDTTNLTIEQLSILCGYRSEVHFYRQFKAVTGYTPAQYRKRM